MVKPKDHEEKESTECCGHCGKCEDRDDKCHKDWLKFVLKCQKKEHNPVILLRRRYILSVEETHRGMMIVYAENNKVVKYLVKEDKDYFEDLFLED